VADNVEEHFSEFLLDASRLYRKSKPTRAPSQTYVPGTQPLSGRK
jgi:hypothetical protein